MCVVTKESNPELYNALFEDENSKTSIEIMNKRGQEIFDELKNVLDKKDKEIDRLNNIIKHIYKELREFNVYGSIAISMQISYLEEYLEEKIENIDFEYLQDLKEGKGE